MHDSLMSAFACMYFQDPSLLAFQQRLQDSTQSNNLKTIFGVDTIPKETQMREIVDSINSDKCLTKNKDSSTKATIYSHQALQPSIMHSDMKQVIPFMPEEIRNEDGDTKQDCEVNAAKRLIPKIR